MSIRLMKEEKIVWKSFPGKKYRTFLFVSQFGLPLILGIILFNVSKELNFDQNIHEKFSVAVLLIVGVLGLLYALYNQVLLLFLQYYITSDRVIIQKGFLNKQVSSIKHEHIHDIKIEQSLSQRMISTGHIFIFTANDSTINPNDSNFLNNVPCFANIDNPFQVHQLLEEAVEQNSKQ